MSGFVSEVRYALRSLNKSRTYAAAFVITLGLGIGVNTAIFSVINGVLLKPLPYQDADRIMFVQQPANRAGAFDAAFSFIEIDDYRAVAYALIELEIEVDARTARLNVSGVVESTGSPIIDPFSGDSQRARINLPNGFEYTVAEMGSGSSKLTGGIELELTDSYGQFNILHMNQDGVIR